MCTETENNKLPNYRIYDRTGGGVTEDIYAASFADAIEQGREWIEEGNWGDNDEEESDGGKTHRTIELECSVYKIVVWSSMPTAATAAPHRTTMPATPSAP